MEIWKVDTKPTVVYEEPEFIVINKPWGLISHPKNPEDKSYSVTQWLVEQYPEAANTGDDPTRPGMMHRLDRETSGLLVLAKTQRAFDYFKNLFQTRKIQKRYLALVEGNVKADKGKIETALGRIGIKRTARVVKGALNDPKEAITEYTVVKRFAKYTLLDVSPKTGRTHQIRVHLKSVGHAVVCDRVYGGRRMKSPPGLDRLFLHAYKLEFPALDGKKLTLEADMPEELQNFINTLQ